MKRTLITGLAAAALVAGGLGLAGGTAQAEPGPSYSGGNCPADMTCTHWCPGDPLIPGSEFGVITWDWNVCHDWYWNSEGVVDVATMIVYPWHGTPHVTAPRRRCPTYPLRLRRRGPTIARPSTSRSSLPRSVAGSEYASSAAGSRFGRDHDHAAEMGVVIVEFCSRVVAVAR